MSTISASTTTTTAYKVTADTTGTLVLQTGSSPTTAVTISSAQVVTFANPPSATGAGGVSTNTAYGTTALNANTTGAYNTAIGYQAAINNLGGNGITALGAATLLANTSGSENTAIGGSNVTYAALRFNTTGSYNTAVGAGSLASNTTASNSTAVGYQALYSSNRTSDTSAGNVALGYQAGYSAVASQYGTFVGIQAGYSSTGNANTFIGQVAGYYVTTGAKNTIIGGYTGNQSGLDIRTLSNYIVLSDGDGNPRYRIDQKGNLQNDTTYNSNSLLRQISRGGGNATETFTAADMGMSDNMTCLINVSLVGSTTFNTYGGTLIYWYMPYGGNSAIQSTLVAAFKGAGITTFSVSASGNSLVVSKDSARGVSVTVIGGGGIAVI